MHIHGGHACHRLPHPVHLAAGDVEGGDHPHVVAGLAHGNGRANRQLGEIGRGYDRQHAFQPFGARGVDARDARMRVRAAQQLGMHHARQRQVGRVDRLARDALLGVHARQPLADDLERWAGSGRHRLIVLACWRRQPRWPRQSCRSLCSGRGCRRWRGGCRAPWARGSRRATPWRTARCQVCRSRIACR